MNRELKFRAWHKPTNEMYWFDVLNGMKHGTGGGYIPMALVCDAITIRTYKDNLKAIDPMDCELMQYTGLQDKNGKEIYEGDILLCHEYDSSDIGGKIIQTFKNAVVGFENGSFYYYPKGNMKQHHQLLMYAYMPEIIGNIYQNPELLNKQ